MMPDDRLKPFERRRYLNLETFRKTGVGVATPVWFVAEGDTIWIYSVANLGKVKRIRNNPKVRIAPCNFRGRVQGDWVDARARIVTGEDERLGHQLLARKYGWLKKISKIYSRLRGREHAVIAINLI
ncbi:MAG: PPOX class F420-dependent oxidoreductase [Burkholderiales bacterium]